MWEHIRNSTPTRLYANGSPEGLAGAGFCGPDYRVLMTYRVNDGVIDSSVDHRMRV